MHTLSDWFPAVYVEVQNHHIIHENGITDDELADAMVGLADQAGLPVVITQDSHYLDEQTEQITMASSGLSLSDQIQTTLFSPAMVSTYATTTGSRASW